MSSSEDFWLLTLVVFALALSYPKKEIMQCVCMVLFVNN